MEVCFCSRNEQRFEASEPPHQTTSCAASDAVSQGRNASRRIANLLFNARAVDHDQRTLLQGLKSRFLYLQNSLLGCDKSSSVDARKRAIGSAYKGFSFNQVVTEHVARHSPFNASAESTLEPGSLLEHRCMTNSLFGMVLVNRSSSERKVDRRKMKNVAIMSVLMLTQRDAKIESIEWPFVCTGDITEKDRTEESDTRCTVDKVLLDLSRETTQSDLHSQSSARNAARDSCRPCDSSCGQSDLEKIQI